MLFLFRGHNGPIARAVIGAILLVVGVAIHGGALLVGIGAVLLVWAAMAAGHERRIRRQNGVGTGGTVS